MNLSRTVLSAATLAAILLAATPAYTQSFEPFIGSWIGNASSKTDSGARIRCTASNHGSGGNIHMTIRCGGNTISATIQENAGKLSGTWSSSGISGTISGIRSNNIIRAQLTSAVFTADVVIVRRGRVLQISLNPSIGDRMSVAMTQ